jgi:cytochrome c-type biogenesis protein CcmH
MKKSLIARIVAVLSFFVIGIAAQFAIAQEVNDKMTQSQEERFNALGREIRCVVCASEPVATSSAKVAIDMRNVIKEHILKGESDDEIREFFATHYGEYVLLRPQVNKVTYILWLTPLLLLALGGVLLYVLRKDSAPNEVELNEDEIKEAQKILDDLK